MPSLEEEVDEFYLPIWLVKETKTLFSIVLVMGLEAFAVTLKMLAFVATLLHVRQLHLIKSFKHEVHVVFDSTLTYSSPPNKY